MLAATSRPFAQPALVTAPVAAAQPPPPPPDPAAGVPEIVVDRRVDVDGNVTSLRSYQRGRLLGKVRGFTPMGVPAHGGGIVAVAGGVGRAGPGPSSKVTVGVLSPLLLPCRLSCRHMPPSPCLPLTPLIHTAPPPPPFPPPLPLHRVGLRAASSF